MPIGKPDSKPVKSTGKKVATKAAPQMPASYSLADQIKQDLAKVKDQTEAFGMEKVRLSAKGFKAPDGAIHETLQCVIVDFVSENAHFESVYDKDNPTPPDCNAIGRNPNELSPEANLKGTPEGITKCANCPNNVFGSGVGNSKACKNTRSLALLGIPADTDTPLWSMSIPPGSIRYFDTYINGVLRAKHAVTSICVLTEFYMDTSQEYAAPRMKVVRHLTNEELEFYYSRKSEAEAALLPAS